jgi:hypothetical protein
MVLGPTPEFGILSREPIDLPPGFASLRLRVEPFL